VKRGHRAGSEPGHLARGIGLFRRRAYLARIAGVILTIGMGVDSNVLIFERIREELRASRPRSRRGTSDKRAF